MSKSKNVIYRQCELESGASRWLAWIPIHLAVQGKTFVIKETGVKARVKEVFVTQVDHAQVVAMGEYYKHQREASDI